MPRTKQRMPAATDTFQGVAAAFIRSITAANYSADTRKIYEGACEDLARYLADMRMPLDPTSISREHIETYLIHLQQGVSKTTGKPYSAATVETRYRGLKAFFRWLVEMGELPSSPMERIKHPKVPVIPPPVLAQDQLRALLRVCSGTSFRNRRDLAMLLIFIDTGLRVGELAGIELSDCNFPPQGQPTLRIMGKGARGREVPLGTSAASALDVYLTFARSRHKLAASNRVWLSERGALTRVSIGRIVSLRGKEAGIERCYPHLLRHTAASMWLEAGGQEHDLIMIMGWSSTTMLSRYGASARASRAREAHKRLSPADRLRRGKGE